jgi:hypothetical protein
MPARDDADAFPLVGLHPRLGHFVFLAEVRECRFVTVKALSREDSMPDDRKYIIGWLGVQTRQTR